MAKIVEAQSNGVTPKPIDAWLKKYNYTVKVARPKIGPKDSKTFSIRAFTKIGLTGYDFKSLIFKHPWLVLTGRWRKEKDPNNKMFCSEYVAWLYHIENSDRITPHALYNHTHTKESGFNNYTFEYDLI